MQFTFEQWIPNMLAVAHAGLPQNGQANKVSEGTKTRRERLFFMQSFPRRVSAPQHHRYAPHISRVRLLGLLHQYELNGRQPRSHRASLCQPLGLAKALDVPQCMCQMRITNHSRLSPLRAET